MKSRYGWTVPAEDAALTHVEAGSPMGELMRRHWQPVALSEELKDLPRRVRILCEDLVLFRTGSGEVGCLELHCSHRGTSLEWGRVEERGIRCCYHGWLYDTQGRILEMPCETPEVLARTRVEHPAYPAMEFGGVVFLYMGPPEKKPLFPMYDIIDTRHRKDVVLKGMRIWGDHSIGYVRDCNWLQHYENVMDPWHLSILHQMISGEQFEGVLMQGKTRIEFENTPLGTRYHVIKDLPNGNRLSRYAECILPNIFLVPNIHEKGTAPKHEDRCSELSWCVPIDNEHICGISIVAWPLENGEPKKDWRPRTDTVLPIRPGARREMPYEERQRKPDDMEAQEGQRAIAVHALEHLVPADKGIAMLRRQLREQAKRVQAGEDPINIVRDEAQNQKITTHAWNTVLAPGQIRPKDAATADA